MAVGAPRKSLLSEKTPDGPRHWYVHAGDFWDGVFHGARTPAFPLTLDGALKPGARVLGVMGTNSNKDLLAPIFDGNRAVVTRDYWVDRSQQLFGWFKDYDLAGRLVSETGPFGAKAAYTWDHITGDLLEAAFSGKTPRHQFSFDGNHHLITWRREGKLSLHFTYGLDGLLKSWREGKGSPWFLRFDTEGRLLAARHSSRGWNFAWDRFNRVQSVSDPKGATHQLNYDSQEQSFISARSKVVSYGTVQGSFGIGKPMVLPRGCDLAFESLLAGANGPLIQRLLTRP